MQQVFFQDLGNMDYQSAWDYQEKLLQQNVAIKSASWKAAELAGKEPQPVIGGSSGNEAIGFSSAANESSGNTIGVGRSNTRHYLLFVEHPPVYTLGKSGHEEHVLLSEEEMQKKGLSFFRTNRGGDITYHGPGQVVGYPILDLEKFYTDIGKYLRSLEEVIILTIAEYGLKGERSSGETGVWLDPSIKGKERKICAMGVRCSRWITMHGFALNVNTDLTYFGNIVPCGIPDKQVTSLEKELGCTVSMEEVKEKLKGNFEKVFGVELVDDQPASG